MSDAVQALLRQAVEEASREAVAEAERRGLATIAITYKAMVNTIKVQ
jgi:hypothetical protein